jgi:AcrR family transcriptional regulator
MSATAVGLRERNRRRRVERILEATRELLREVPGESPSVERIAERAEVAPATVFNLVGPREQIWAALADAMFADLDLAPPSPDDDPHTRAREIAAVTVDALCADPAVHRHVLAHWSQAGRLLREDPTPQLVACLQAAAQRGQLRDGVDLRRLGTTTTAACGGAAHQWAAGLIGDRAVRERCRTAVDVAFAAAGHREAARSLG